MEVSLFKENICCVFYNPLTANWAASEFYQHDSQLTTLVACLDQLIMCCGSDKNPKYAILLEL